MIGVDEDRCCYNCNRTIPLLISHFPMRGAGELRSSIIVHYARRHIMHLCRLDDRVVSVPFFARHDRSFPCFPCVWLASGSSALLGHIDPIGFLIVLMAETSLERPVRCSLEMLTTEHLQVRIGDGERPPRAPLPPLIEAAAPFQ